jgi:membrane-associated phospholipid phosphatase
VIALTRPRAFFAGLVLFAATAALVEHGSLTRLDQHAVTHLMPWLQARPVGHLTVWSLTVPSLHLPIAKALLTLWVYPAAVLPSALLVGAAAWTLHRRGDDEAAATWCVLWFVANVLEVAGKWLIERPALYSSAGFHVSAFDHGLPSGHTLRSLVVAGALAYTWRWGWLAVVWAGSVAIALVPLGWHTPTDVAAGIFVALMLWGLAPRPSRSRG